MQEPQPKRSKSEEKTFVTLAPATLAPTYQSQTEVSDDQQKEEEAIQPTGTPKQHIKLFNRRTDRPPIIIKLKKVSGHEDPPSYRTVPPTPSGSPLQWNPYDLGNQEEEMVTPIVGRDRLNRYVDTNINCFLSATSCGPFFLDNENDFEKLSALCPSQLHVFPRGHSFTEFEKNSNIAKMLCFADIAGFVFKEQFTELLLSDAKIKYEPSLENDWSNPLNMAQQFFDLENNDIRDQIVAFIDMLNRNNTLGARSHRSLKLFAHLLASAETSQECLLALLNVKATMRPGLMRDKYLNTGFQLLERASRMLNYNIIKNGARIYAFTTESPGILTINTKQFLIGREPLITFSDARQKRFRLCSLRPCFHASTEDLVPKMFIVQALSDEKDPRIPIQEYYRRKLHLDSFGALSCSTSNLRTVKGVCSFLTGTGHTWTIPFPRLQNANQHTGLTP